MKNVKSLGLLFVWPYYTSVLHYLQTKCSSGRMSKFHTSFTSPLLFGGLFLSVEIILIFIDSKSFYS